MADKGKTPATLEEALEVITALTASNVEATKKLAAAETANAELTAQVEALTNEGADLKKSNASLNKEVPGTYTSKKDKKVYAFRKGRLSIPWNGSKISSVDALANADIMEELIAMGSAVIEEVKA